MRHRKRYRWFIRARPDIAYRHSLPPLEAWPTRGEHWAALEANDVFGIMTRGPARALFQTLPTKLLEECATGAVDNGQLFLQSLRSYRLAVPHVIPARNNQAATGITIVRPCHVEEFVDGQFHPQCTRGVEWNEEVPIHLDGPIGGTAGALWGYTDAVDPAHWAPIKQQKP